MSLTRRTLFRGAFVAAGYFLTRGVLRAEERQWPRVFRLHVDPFWEVSPDPFWAELEKRQRAFYESSVAANIAAIQTTPSATHWLESSR